MSAMDRLAVRLVVAAALAVTALLAVAGSLSGPARWSPDGLFYQARVYEIRDDMTQGEALKRAFQGPLGERLRAIDPERSGAQQWVAYNARFYERRIAVPLAASAIEPLAGDRAILDVSLAGYVAAVLAIYWLLLVVGLRTPIAAGATLLTIFLPALTHHAALPLTDTWGLALQAAAFATALLALRRGPWWLAPWVAAIALLSITRDSMWIPILAAGWLAVTQRSRIAVLLAGTGLAAALPATLAVSVPMRELLAQMFNNAMPAPDAPWSDVVRQFPGAIVDLLQADGGFVRDGAWYSAAFLLGGLALLFLLSRGRHSTPATTLMKAGAVAGVAFVLAVPIFSVFRIELVLVPMAAVGLALGIERMAALAVERGWAKPPSRKSGPVPRTAFRDLGSDSP